MTDAPAAFDATIHGLRTVPSRKVVQVVVEAPIEYLARIAEIAEHGAWVAIARIQSPPETSPVAGSVHGGRVPSVRDSSDTDQRKPAPDQSVGVPARAKRRWDDMTPAQQAGMLCADESFRGFIADQFPGEWESCCASALEDETVTDLAAKFVRDHCKVSTRRDINNNSEEWRTLVDTYRVWQKYPEHV